MYLPEHVTSSTPLDWILESTILPAVAISIDMCAWRGSQSFTYLISTLEFCRHFFCLDKGEVRLRKKVLIELQQKSTARRRVLIREASGMRRFYLVVVTQPKPQSEDSWLLFFLHSLPLDNHVVSYPATFRKGESSSTRTEFSIQLGKRLRIAQQMELKLLVFVLDIVGFRSVNESEGYYVGDKVLSILQHRLGFIAKHNGIIAHIADDDYAVGLLIEDHPEAIHRALMRMNRAVRKPYYINENKQRLFLRLAIGAALSDANTDSAWRLVEQARTACVSAKRQAIGDVVVYDSQQRYSTRERFRLEQKLFQAIESGAFHVVIQPQFAIADNSVIGAEILTRWSEEDGTAHSPAEFIPVLEEMGLMPKLSEWVLHQAITIQTQVCQYIANPPPLSINLSPTQIESPAQIQRFLTAIESSSLPGEFFEVEITEDSLLHHHDKTLNNLHRLNQAGVAIALDDFGVGYSSLSYLSQFPIQKLKIDRSFITHITDDHKQRQLVTLMLNIANTFGMKPLAEGVELAEQVECLQALGCQYVQGYLYAKPESVGDYLARY